jgi:O-antigen/teichoic acid export membrane protein
MMRRLLAGSAWNLLATICTRGGTFAANIVVARLIGRAGFGQYGIVQSTLLTLGTLAEAGMAYTASKYVAEYRNVDVRRVSSVLGVCASVCIGAGVLAAGFLFLTAPFIATRLLHQPQLAGGLRIGSGFALLSAVSGFQAGALSGLESYRELAEASVLNGILSVIVIGVGALKGGVDGALGGLTIAVLIRCAVQQFILHRAFRRWSIKIGWLDLSGDRDVLFRFAVPAAISGYALMPVFWIANALLVRQSHGIEEMAIYSAVMNVRSLVLFIPAVINTVGLTLLNQTRGGGDSHQYRNVARMNVAVIAVVAAAAVLGAAALGKLILRAYGSGFVAGYSALLLLLLSAFGEALYMGYFQRIQSQEKMWLSLFGIVLPSQAAFLCAAFVFVPHHGAFGLSGAYLINTCLMIACTFGCLHFLNRSARNSAPLLASAAKTPSAA